jgi:RimJ/RimL family protein N-acetyltransferase
MKKLETTRLILREWTESDKPAFAAMNADPVVMEYMDGLKTREQSDAMVGRIQDHFNKYGFGLYAAELKNTGEFIGFIGLTHIPFEAHFTPAVEIGWRLAAPQWNKGYATEGAKRVLEYAFNDAGLNEVVSMTTVQNIRSRRVMDKLGMACDEQDNFAHPKLAPDHPLSNHVLYRLKRTSP